MVSCANATTDGGLCSNTRTGGKFSGTAEVTLALPPVAGGMPADIFYTTDGSDPAGGSGSTAQPYGKMPLKLSATTTLRIVASRHGVGALQQRNVTFLKE
jgi:hypothetical protein